METILVVVITVLVIVRMNVQKAEREKELQNQIRLLEIQKKFKEDMDKRNQAARDRYEEFLKG